MGATFDSRLVRAVALVASGVLHAGVLIALFTSDLPLRAVQVPIEIVTLPPPPAAERTASQSDAPSPEDLATLPTPMPAPPTVDDTPGGSRPMHYREVLRERERAFDAAMRARAARLTTLAAWNSAKGPTGDGDDDNEADEADEVRACGARDAGVLVKTQRERDMERYASFVPTGLFPSRYTAGMTQVIARDRAGLPQQGRLEFALPARTTPVQLDDPAGTLFALGRDDARCLIGFTWQEDDVFPLQFTNVPARYVDGRDQVYETLLDVELAVDGSFTLRTHDGDALPISRGTLFDQKTVARNLSQHAVGAHVVKGLMDSLFGG